MLSCSEYNSMVVSVPKNMLACDGKLFWCCKTGCDYTCLSLDMNVVKVFLLLNGFGLCFLVTWWCAVATYSSVYILVWLCLLYCCFKRNPNIQYAPDYCVPDVQCSVFDLKVFVLRQWSHHQKAILRVSMCEIHTAVTHPVEFLPASRSVCLEC